MMIGMSFVVIIVLPATFAPALQPKYGTPASTLCLIISIKSNL